MTIKLLSECLDDGRVWADDFNEIKCPNCGGDFLHHEYVVVHAQSSKYINAYDHEKQHETDVCRNPSSDRNGITIGFSCETCDDLIELQLMQHKGVSAVQMTTIPNGRYYQRLETV